MTTFPVAPSNTGPPQFTPTFDGDQYIVRVVWSLFGQRYYVSCYDLFGNLIFNVPLTESPTGVDIQTLDYDELSGLAEGVATGPHGFKTGSTTRLTIAGASPDIYNGTFLVLATGPTSFSFPLTVSSYPGPATMAGVLSFDISMSAGYFTSTLVYRNSSFVVSP